MHSAIGGVPLPFVYGGQYEIKGPIVTSLWFTDDNTIVVTFVLRDSSDGRPEMPTRNGAAAALPLRLRAIFLDAATGKITATTVWPSEYRWSKIIAVHDGHFIIQRGNELTLYSSDLSALHDVRLPPHNEMDWYGHPSSTGANILFVSSSGYHLDSWLWVDSDTLRVVHAWEQQPAGPVSIADDKIALSGVCWSLNCQPPSLEIRGLSTEWVPVSPGGNLRIQFVNNDMLFLSGNAFSGKPMSLIRTNGKTIFNYSQPPPSDSSHWDAAVVSVGGRRFIIPGYRTKGRVAALDIGGHSELNRILVCDVSHDGQPRLVDLEGPKISYPWELALSPDGSKLAILDGEALEVLQLPPLQ